MTQRTFVFDGVAQLIASLVERDVPWGVVTNKSMRFTGPLTKGMPLFATSRAVVGGDSTPHSKPHPAPLLEAARQLGCRRSVRVRRRRRARHRGRPRGGHAHRGRHLRLPGRAGRRGRLARGCQHFDTPLGLAGPLEIPPGA
jgi:hypothetical protein